MAVWTGAGLLGDFALIPLLERVQGLRYLWISALLELALFPAVLLTSDFTASWCCSLCSVSSTPGGMRSCRRSFTRAAGRSGTALAVKNVSGIVGR